MNWLVVLPILVPLTSAALSMLAWRSPATSRRIALAGSAIQLCAALALLLAVRRDGIQTSQIGAWSAPYGVTLVADLFSAIMIVLAALIGLAVIVYSLDAIDMARESFEYYPLMHALLLGVCGAFLTGDLFNLYVWLEVMLIASFVLLALGGRLEQIEGAIKYVILNLFASALLLMSIGVLYGITGTLNLADLAVKLESNPDPGLTLVLAMMLLIAFGTKAAAFPLFFWLPASYHTPPIAISTIFAALLTKVGVYAIVRLFTLIFVNDTGFTHALILVVAGLTMLTGVLGAIAQSDIRRLLSFHIISQIGYLLMGLGLFTPLAMTGMIYFMVHVMLAKSALFLVGGLIRRVAGSYQLQELGGLYGARPGLAALFLVPALSLAGMPPFPGFFAKLALIQTGLRDEQYLIIATAIVASLLTLYYLIRIWTEAFWKPAPQTSRAETGSLSLLFAPTIGVVVLVVALGLAAEPMLELSGDAAAQLLDRDQYIEAVLGRER